MANAAYQVADDVTLVRGRHQLALGGNWRTGSPIRRTSLIPTAHSASTARRPAAASPTSSPGSLVAGTRRAEYAAHDQWYLGSSRRTHGGPRIA